MKTHILSFAIGALVTTATALYLWPSSQTNSFEETKTPQKPTAIYFTEPSLYNTIKGGPISAFNGTFSQKKFLDLYSQNPAFQMDTQQPFEKACISYIGKNEFGELELSLAFTLFKKERSALVSFLKANPNKPFFIYADNYAYPISSKPDAVQSYAQFELENADKPDLIFTVRQYQLGTILQVYQSFFPYQPPLACDETIALSTIPHWDKLMDQMWGKYNY
ncbi:hypothetical protein KFE96_06615 [Kordiimonas sp. SCSIO 12603]|uniref:hypothetical protein n=1 Tax=Kordiimonas sp. SCSIO 12603 TaxID=2829596 RepID=UPI002105F2B0|nr:hypothetical protein [Kordiimonas sp. SCSIO 12603]UTW59973.1 hypothetical protein KFE96_06615 [Kordiimonas sp. SCSIO 12603]